MTGKETIEVLRAAITRVQQQGSDSISAERLQTLLAHLESGQAEKDLGLLWQAKKESGLAKYRVQADLILEQFKATIRTGQGALKSMFLINGGAAVAILALIGHLSTSPVSVSKGSQRNWRTFLCQASPRVLPEENRPILQHEL